MLLPMTHSAAVPQPEKRRSTTAPSTQQQQQQLPRSSSSGTLNEYTLFETLEGNRLQAVRNAILLASLSIITKTLEPARNAGPIMLAIASIGVYLTALYYFYVNLMRLRPHKSYVIPWVQILFELLLVAAVGFSFVFVT